MNARGREVPCSRQHEATTDEETRVRELLRKKELAKWLAYLDAVAQEGGEASVSGNFEQQQQVLLAPICGWQILGAVSQDMKNRQAANG